MAKHETLGRVLKPFFGIIHSFSFNSSISILKIQPEWYIYIHWIILVDFFLNKFWICRLFFIMINERTSSIPSHRRIIDSSSVDIYATFVINPLVKLLLGKKFPLWEIFQSISSVFSYLLVEIIDRISFLRRRMILFQKIFIPLFNDLILEKT